MSVWILFVFYLLFFFKQKTAYELRISDWSSDVCSSDLLRRGRGARHRRAGADGRRPADLHRRRPARQGGGGKPRAGARGAGGDEIGRASCRERECAYV